jgi:hypothetical protein
MKLDRRRVLSPAALVALLVLAAGFVAAVVHRPARPPVRLLGRPAVVRASVSPQDPQFGDTVLAALDVFTDSSRVDPRSVHVATRFAPYAAAATRRTVETAGGVTIIRVESRLRCLDVACVPPGDSAPVSFPAARVTFSDGVQNRVLLARWPALRVHSRLAQSDVLHPRVRIPAPEAGGAGYRLPPRATGYALLGLAAVLAAVGAALLAWVAVRRRRPHPSGSSLDRVLRELAAASQNGDTGRRRRALEQLALELEPVDRELSLESRVLAWSAQDPPPEAVSELASRVRTAVPR